LVLIDGNKSPVLSVPSEAIVGGDAVKDVIAAASILAKTARDDALLLLHEEYPHYAFDRHKGYPTALHIQRLRIYGVSLAHRKSFAPVRRLLADEAVHT
jgi:ribonuclease HII